MGKLPQTVKRAWGLVKAGDTALSIFDRITKVAWIAAMMSGLSLGAAQIARGIDPSFGIPAVLIVIASVLFIWNQITLRRREASGEAGVVAAGNVLDRADPAGIGSKAQGQRPSRRAVWDSVIPAPDSPTILEVLAAPRAPPATDEDQFREAFDERVSGWMPFVQLRDFAPAWGVPLPRIGVGQNNAHYLEIALRQAAVRGILRVEGRQHRAVRFGEPLIPIPADHFKEFGFGHGVLNYGGSNEASHTGNVRMMTQSQRGIEDVTFYDLHLSERDARMVVLELAKDPKIERP